LGGGADNGGDLAGIRGFGNDIGSALSQIVASTGVSLANSAYGVSSYGGRLKGFVKVGGQYVDGLTYNSDTGGKDLGKDPNEAAGRIIKAILTNAASGLTETMRTVLKSATVKTAEEVGKALDFAKWYDGIGKVTDNLDGFRQVLAGINSQFNEYAATARQYGLSEAKIQQARQEAIKQATEQQIKASTGGIRDFLANQPLSALSSASPTARFTTAQEQFAAGLTKARAGDQDAIAAITGQAQNVLSFGAQMYGTATPEFAALEGNVRSTLDTLASTIETNIRNAAGGTAPVVSAVEKSAATQAKATAASTEALTTELQKMQKQNQQLIAEVQRLTRVAMTG
jgi:hypothetical protein